ncbi:MAG: type II secretion system minor pseudopilin GspH [Legionella sp.]
MPKLVIGMSIKPYTKCGFTLIEILVVVLIISMTTGFALLAFNDFGTNRQAMIAAEEFVNHLQFTQQLAVLESATYGIQLFNNGYRIISYQPNTANWVVLNKNAAFQKQFFPTATRISLESQTTVANTPPIIIDQSGGVNDFAIRITDRDDHEIVKIISQSDGTISLLPKNSS